MVPFLLVISSFLGFHLHTGESADYQGVGPTVRVICGADGKRLTTPPLLDLSETTADGHYARSVIKVIDPEKYNIRTADYFI